jgi:hypothetical protein
MIKHLYFIDNEQLGIGGGQNAECEQIETVKSNSKLKVANLLRRARHCEAYQRQSNLSLQ